MHWVYTVVRLESLLCTCLNNLIQNISISRRSTIFAASCKLPSFKRVKLRKDDISVCTTLGLYLLLNICCLWVFIFYQFQPQALGYSWIAIIFILLILLHTYFLMYITYSYYILIILHNTYMTYLYYILILLTYIIYLYYLLCIAYLYC